jgi:hypothetical protein
VAGSLPGLIDLYEEHKDHRDNFEILAFHDNTVKDFTELDKKLVKVKAANWGGRDLPFPILLDATGATIQTWGITHFPTTVLIDPQGKLIGEVGADALEQKLPPLPKERRAIKALDRQVTIAMDDLPLGAAIDVLSNSGNSGNVKIHQDPAALKRAGITADTRVPLSLSGALSLRSWLELTLSPFDLTYRTGDDGIHVIFADKPAAREKAPSAPQEACAQRLAKRLAEPVSFEFKNTPLRDVAKQLETLTGESFLVDPVARQKGKVALTTPVTGSAKNVPLGQALADLLRPAGLRFVVSHELVLFTTLADEARQKETSGGKSGE